MDRCDRRYESLYETHTFYAVQLAVEDSRLTPGRPEELFEANYRWANPARSYDVTPDGRFLFIKYPDDSTLSAAIEEFYPTRIQVVQNWFTELREKMPENE